MPARFETYLLGLCVVCWSLALAHFGGLISLAGPLPLSLYGLYSVAGIAGWLSGNLYAGRRKRLPPPLQRRMLVLYSLGPPGMLYLLRALAPAADQLAAPFVQVWALIPYAGLFLVPLVLTWTPGGGARDRGDER